MNVINLFGRGVALFLGFSSFAALCAAPVCAELISNAASLGVDASAGKYDVNRLIKKARDHERIGNYSLATPIWEEVAKWVEKVGGSSHPDTATILNNLANSYAKEGMYGKAEQCFLRSLSIRESLYGKDHPSVAAINNYLAEVYHDQGMYSKAEELYLRALRSRQKALSPGDLGVAISLINLASLYADQGLHSKSEALYLDALRMREESLGGDDPLVADVLNNLGASRNRQGDYLLAEKYYARALSIYEKNGLDSGEGLAGALSNLAYLLKSRGAFIESERYYKRALSAYGGKGSNYALSLNNLAALYLSMGRYPDAEKQFLASKGLVAKYFGSDHIRYGSSLANLAVFYDSRQAYDKATPLYRQSLATASAFIQREASFLPRSLRSGFIDSLIWADEVSFSYASRGHSGVNLALFTRLNRQGLLEEIEKRQAKLASLPGDQQQVALELKQVTEQLSSWSISAEQRKTLKARQEELERQLYRLLPELKPRIVEVEQVAAALPKDGALVEYQRYRPYDGQKKGEARFGAARYLALVLKPDASIKAVDLGLAAPIDQRVQQALMASEQKLGDAQELWDQVGSQIINPLTSALSGVQTLFISPDGELNRIPFAALPAPGGQELLAEAMKLRLLTTGRELLDLAKPSAPSTNPALVVANPAFDQRAAAGSTAAQGFKSMSGQRSVFAEPGRQRSADLTSLRWDPLPGTAEEGAAIAALTKGKLLSGAQASASAIQASAAPQVLHIASHAFFLPDVQVKSPTIGQNRGSKEASGGAAELQGESPLLRSGIALAGANQAKAIDSASDTADDGYLTALEVAQLDWKGTELVVISACESGTGDIQAGEGVYGLKRAIAVAGARSSLLSLWKVDDKATAAFMESFYQKLKAGQSRADALASTQKEFREHSNASWRHPYVWAAFQLSGDWRPLKH